MHLVPSCQGKDILSTGQWGLLVSIPLNVPADHPLDVRQREAFRRAPHSLFPAGAMMVINQVQDGGGNCRSGEVSTEKVMSQSCGGFHMARELVSCPRARTPWEGAEPGCLSHPPP